MFLQTAARELAPVTTNCPALCVTRAPQTRITPGTQCQLLQTTAKKNAHTHSRTLTHTHARTQTRRLLTNSTQVSGAGQVRQRCCRHRSQSRTAAHTNVDAAHTELTRAIVEPSRLWTAPLAVAGTGPQHSSIVQVVDAHTLGEEAAGRSTVQRPVDGQVPTAAQVATTKVVPVHRAVAALATNPGEHSIVQTSPSAILVIVAPHGAVPPPIPLVTVATAQPAATTGAASQH